MAKRDRQLERPSPLEDRCAAEDHPDLLLRYGFQLQSVSGSYWVYNHKALQELVVCAIRRPVLPVYVRAVIKATDEVLEYENS